MMNIFAVVRVPSKVSHIVAARKMSTAAKPIEAAIREGLTNKLFPVHLEVVNESYMHNVPKGAETHFKVLVVSEQFDGLPLIKRHRLVNEVVKEKLEGNFVHALSIEAKTPSQWNESYKLDPSPKCLGGFGK
ncbi:bolA-like protein DDB_G0274169 [Topomyia yanbarensis]|uniref:bolA-like protein DDB_G0274169 n=1 Tax=Topomyia yanbarensis TaxID=2498891 RepID=UPI00273C7D0D|nr:bolA-like protein DDB_G0274169 [Topomyia yanbarensis]